MSQRSKPTTLNSKFLDFNFEENITSFPMTEQFYAYLGDNKNDDEFNAKLSNQLKSSMETLKILNLSLNIKSNSSDSNADFSKLMAPKKTSYNPISQKIIAFEL